MLRDDIKFKVIELLNLHFQWTERCREEDDLQKDLLLSASEVRDFAEILLEEFEVEELPLSSVMEWVCLRDVINTVEENLA